MKVDKFIDLLNSLEEKYPDLEFHIIVDGEEEFKIEPEFDFQNNLMFLSFSTKKKIQTIILRPAIGPKEILENIDDFLKENPNFIGKDDKYNPYELWVAEKVPTETGTEESIKAL